MKSRSLSITLAVLTSLAAGVPMFAASAKGRAGIEALVAALQAASPDPLGGRFGLEVAAIDGSENALRFSQAARLSPDQLAYLQWKKTLKS